MWNQPSKRKHSPKKIENITFKRIKLRDEEKPLPVKQQIVLPDEHDLSKFRDKLCSRLGNHTNAAIFSLLPSIDNTIPTESDLNVSLEETVETSLFISHQSDKYINIMQTVKERNMSQEEALSFLEDCDQDVIYEIEERTRGQSDNDLWLTSRKARITASVFHDISTRKSNTPPEKLVERILGNSGNNKYNEFVPSLKWGKKMENVAKKHYIAINKLKFKRKIQIQEKGLILHKDYSYLGASPDGIVVHNSTKHLIEVKCPYKWRTKSVTEACRDSDFFCFVDENNDIQLKHSSRYYTQIQGQMGICCVKSCDLVVYTTKQTKIIPVSFDEVFWENLLKKLIAFYKQFVLHKLSN